MRNLIGCTLLLSFVLLAGCACPPVGSGSGGGRSSSGSDPSGGTFAFLGGLRCFFGGDDTKDEARPVTNADLADKAKTQPQPQDTDHAAALTIR